MSEIVNIELPDIGDFEDVEVIEILKSPGDRVAIEDSLITVESDKASVEIPSPRAGLVKTVLVKIGDKVSRGDVILSMEVEGDVSEAVESETFATTVEEAVDEQPIATPTVQFPGEPSRIQTELVVLGSGPGGYTAAFRAADLGKSVTLVERYPTLGGVCLNVGCIPSKALLHVAQVINEAEHFTQFGVGFAEPKIDLEKLKGWKTGVVGRLTGGLTQLAKQRKVHVLQGSGRFTAPHRMGVQTSDGNIPIDFEQAIIAAGSKPAQLAVFPWDDPRIMDSTQALTLSEIPDRLLVVGGGIIGLEMATVYHALGSRVTVVELTDGLIPGCDRDLIRPLTKIIKNRYENIYVSTKVTHVASQEDGLAVGFEGNDAPEADVFDRILVATGRVPNGSAIGADNAGIQVDDKGFIPVDSQQRTNVPHIFAIGDIVGPPMLAHKATHQGKVAAEVCAGLKSHFDVRAIPSVAYTDPEVAWMGVSESDAKAQRIEYQKGVFPWAASGRSLCLGRDEGLTKLLFDQDKRLIGAGIVGPNAGELIAETILALEMGADPQDIGLSIHPHPTLSETISFAAEAVEGTITDLYISKKTAN